MIASAEAWTVKLHFGTVLVMGLARWLGWLEWSDCLQILNLGRFGRPLRPKFFVLKKTFFFVPNFHCQKMNIFRFFSIKLPLYRVQQVSFINHQSHKKFKARYFENYLEFGDNIAPSCSTDQYFISSKYEVLTPSHHEDMKNQYFQWKIRYSLQRETIDSL